MPGVIGAHHTSFTIADLDRSIIYFQDVLGILPLYVRDVDAEYFGRIVGIPGCVVRAALFLVPGSTHHIELFEYKVPRGKSYRPRPCDPGSTHLSLLVDDLPAFYEQLCRKGITGMSEPILITSGPNKGGFGLYLSDPNGILIELFQPPSPKAS